LILLTLLFGIVPVFLRKRKIFSEVRKVEALDSLDHMVSICAEKDRPLFLSSGYGINPQSGDTASWLPAIFDIYKYMTKKAAVLGVKTITSSALSVGMVMTRDVIQQAYVEAGHPELFVPENCVWTGRSLGTLGIVDMGIMQDRKPGGCACIGGHPLQTENPALEQGVINDCYITTAQNYPDEQSTLILCSDAILFAGETIAAGAYLSEDPIRTSTIIGMDFAGFFSIALIAIFSILHLVGMV
jgi:hypothetical protein